MCDIGIILGKDHEPLAIEGCPEWVRGGPTKCHVHGLVHVSDQIEDKGIGQGLGNRNGYLHRCLGKSAHIIIDGKDRIGSRSIIGGSIPATTNQERSVSGQSSWQAKQVTATGNLDAGNGSGNDP